MQLANPRAHTERLVSRLVAPNGDVFEMWREVSNVRIVIQCRVNGRIVTPAEFDRLARAGGPALEQ